MADISIKNVLNADSTDCRLGALLIALILYGMFGEPTPDQLSWAEITIGLLLVYAASVGVISTCFRLKKDELWRFSAKLLFIYGMTVPLLGGLLYGNSPSLIIRDVIPFIFILIPLFLEPLVRQKDTYLPLVIWSVVFIGVSFSMRVLMPALDLQFAGGSGWFGLVVSDPGYLVNAPTVLFTAILLIGTGGHVLYRSVSFKNITRSTLMFAMAIIPVMAMALIVQRASMGMIAMSVMFLAFVAVINAPARALAPLLVLVIALAFIWSDIQDISALLIHKTSLVGFNNRFQEAAAVFDSISNSYWKTFFGTGWGGTVDSPAVAGWNVNFTHSLFSTYLLKAGVVGMGLIVIYLFAMADLLFRMVMRSPVLAVALTAPFLVDVLLYASFKSLDFGLILFLIVSQTRLQNSAGYSIENEFPDLTAKVMDR